MDINELIKVKAEGYLGVLPSGVLVDRRKHPEALPVSENKTLDVPAPKDNA